MKWGKNYGSDRKNCPEALKNALQNYNRRFNGGTGLFRKLSPDKNT